MEERRIGPVGFIPEERDGKLPHCHSLNIEDKGGGILIDPSSDRASLAILTSAHPE